jgi:hypothetical protein
MKSFTEYIEEPDLDIEDIEPEELTESRFLRGASALVFASKSKQSGDKVVKHARKGQDVLKKYKADMSADDRLQLLQESLVEMFNAQIESRKQLGNLVGVALASALISERSNKQMIQLFKRRR